MHNITDFPVEVQVMILSLLPLPDLISASKVCRLWSDICGWVAKEKFSDVIPEECIQEIENTEVPREDLWLTALKYYYLQKCITTESLTQNKILVAELNANHLCFCTHGPLVFVGSASGIIDVYNPEEAAEPVLHMQLEVAPVLQLEVMAAMNLLLVRTSVNDIVFLSLPHHSGKSWVYEMNVLKSNIQNFHGKIIAERNFSVCGTVFATATDPRQVCVFQLISTTEDTVDLEYLTGYVTNEPISHVSLWNDEVIIIYKTGGILRWYLFTLVGFTTDTYYELHYENPVWIFRGRIFCSTILSTQLLGFWRMDRGARYWLSGKPARALVRCKHLGTADSKDLNGEDVLCVCLKQRLLACGTRNGKILIYFLSDAIFSSDDFNENGNRSLVREFERPPDLTIRTKERPISNIQIQFKENAIIIYTWPCRMQSRPELKGLLQCVVLRENKWEEQKVGGCIYSFQ